MNNIDIYKGAFIEALEVDEGELSTLKYQSVANWDSVGHMGLIAALEQGFDIMMDMDDIINFSSFEEGINILKKYEIIIDIEVLN